MPIPSDRLSLRRRTVLASSTAGAVGAAAVGTLHAEDAAAEAVARPGHRQFRHGVASGDPLPHAVLIWTRVTPTPASTPGSGKGPRVTVTWEVATDGRFRHVVRRGTFATGPSRDHTVKVDVTGLDPATWYHYRFHVAGQTSRVGRTRTAPAPEATPRHLRFGVVSCANLQAGWFSAYRGLADRDDLHAVIHLGDYLYEYGPGQYGYGSDDRDIRSHVPAHEMVSLPDYRQRHAQYKQDRDLQDLHAKYPWIITWDDHEVANDQWKDGAENHNPDLGEGDYHRRRARAHRAYDEWMPVRLDGTARLGDGDRLFRRFRFGTLAELSMLDLRSYRDGQLKTPGADADAADRTITGRQQMDWLKGGLKRAGAQWKVVGNPVMIAPVEFGSVPHDLVDPVNDVTGLLPRDGVAYNLDQWDGYTHDRREVFEHIRDHQVTDALFITGDIHSGWACELPYDASTYPVGDSAGVEFVCSSVTSSNLKDITGTPPRTTSVAVETAIKANNRHIKYLDFDSHGFSVLDITATRAQMDWYVIGDRADRTTPITWSTSYATKTGTGRVEQVAEPLPGGPR
ncbi:alkaline phosphatase [Nocardioides sp. Root1257]|uniref:alkaline phosphatase D family protein n=1 Tax=unclassified Nocardioides TaxID=2615069 RepID=UPI0006F47B05|nr:MULTISPECIES: alkaline phosphatase D family protein [unclassified Nocardioides]KQW49032.1 alkaline phosphatase [Nocardioides sp. Root1257]KRC48206.1 alkaline phosphatase [Nocardioides sp. Root224]